MKQTILSISSLCMMTALCTQFMHSSHYRFAVRMVLGIEVFRLVISVVSSAVSFLK